MTFDSVVGTALDATPERVAEADARGLVPDGIGLAPDGGESYPDDDEAAATGADADETSLFLTEAADELAAGAVLELAGTEDADDAGALLGESPATAGAAAGDAELLTPPNWTFLQVSPHFWYREIVPYPPQYSPESPPHFIMQFPITPGIGAPLVGMLLPQ